MTTILIYILCFVPATFSSKSDAERKRILLYDTISQPSRNAAKIIYLINKLRPHERERDKDHVSNHESLKGYDRNKKWTDGAYLTEVMELLQKNYDTGKKMRNLITSQDRAHIIVVSNPEVLEVFKRRHASTPSSEDSSGYKSDDLGRRNGGLRFRHGPSNQMQFSSPIRGQSKRNLLSDNQESNAQSQNSMETNLNHKPMENNLSKLDNRPRNEEQDEKFKKYDKYDNELSSVDKIRKRERVSEEIDDDYVKRDRIRWSSGEKTGGWVGGKNTGVQNHGKVKRWDVEDGVAKGKSVPKWSLDAADVKKKRDKSRDANSWNNWSSKDYKVNQKKKVNSWRIAPKTSDYNYRPKKKMERSGGSSFGRTPIPFIGKKGIYED